MYCPRPLRNRSSSLRRRRAPIPVAFKGGTPSVSIRLDAHKILLVAPLKNPPRLLQHCQPDSLVDCLKVHQGGFNAAEPEFACALQQRKVPISWHDLCNGWGSEAYANE